MANEQANEFLNSIADQAKGKTTISQQLYDGVIQEAGNWDWSEKEQFLSTLSGKYIDTMYTDTAWTDKYNDVFFQNSEQFGAVVQIINTEMPEVRANRAWDVIQSGTTTIGSNTVYLPVVKEQLVGGSSSWAVPFAITGTQMNTAFESASGLKKFESYVQMSADNAGKYHIARMSASNRNNYILEKLNAGNTAGKINVVNLVQEYCNTVGLDEMTVAEFLANKNGCLRSVNKTFKKYKAFLTDMTTLFSMDSNTNGKFIPEDRFVMQVISDFAGLMESELYATTYHDNFVTLKGYREVPAWQGLRTTSSTLQFSDLTSINAGRNESVLSDESISVSRSNVVALMVDKWAIMHTIVRHRTGVQRDDIKDITLFEHQFTDRYINNLMLNGVVFVLDDVE